MRLKSDLVAGAGREPPSDKLDQVDLQWDGRTALGVVMAAPATRCRRAGDAITSLLRMRTTPWCFMQARNCGTACCAPAVAACSA